MSYVFTAFILFIIKIVLYYRNSVFGLTSIGNIDKYTDNTIGNTDSYWYNEELTIEISNKLY